MPLVPYNKSNAGLLNEDGFKFPGLENAPNKELFQPASALGFEWQPEGCSYASPGMTADGVAQLLAGRWVHIDGDSLARDTYFDLLQAIEQGEVVRVKVHHNLSATIGATRVTMDFNAGDVPLEQRCANPYVAGSPAENFPHVWIYSLSLWDNGARGSSSRSCDLPICADGRALRYHYPPPPFAFPNPDFALRPPHPSHSRACACAAKEPKDLPTDEDMTRIVTCALERKAPGTFGVIRLSSIFSGELDNPSNLRVRNFTVLARAAIAEYNAKIAVTGGASAASTLPWHFWDPWDMLRTRRTEVGFHVDGIHYTGVGSRTMTYGLLQLVAACDKFCEPALARGS